MLEQVKTALGDLMLPFPDTSLLLKDKSSGAVLLSLQRVGDAVQRSLGRCAGATDC